MGIDKENRKLQLGHKQLKKIHGIHWKNTFAIGSIHEGTVIRKDDKGAIVQLPYGLKVLHLPVTCEGRWENHRS